MRAESGHMSPRKEGYMATAVRSLTVAGELDIKSFDELVLGTILRGGHGISEVRVDYKNGQATIWVSGSRDLTSTKRSLERVPGIKDVFFVDDPESESGRTTNEKDQCVA
jgi:hypothetical protein